MATTNNNKYLRLWYEIEFLRIDFLCQSCDEIVYRKSKWFPYNKAGNDRKWSSINEYVVNYENNGIEIKEDVLLKYPYLKNPGFVVKNTETYFHHGITWNDIATCAFCGRYVPNGYIYDAAGPMFFSEYDFEMLAYFNSTVFQAFVNVICQGMHYSTGHIPLVPYISYTIENQTKIEELSIKNTNISTKDWNSLETSWNFQRHPLI